MRSAWRHLWARHRLLLMAFIGAATLTLLFSVRSIVFMIYWSNPAHRDQALAGWMVPGYVAYSYQVPRKAVIDALGVSRIRRGRTLAGYAKESGIPLKQLEARLNAAIAAHRARAK